MEVSPSYRRFGFLFLRRSTLSSQSTPHEPPLGRVMMLWCIEVGHVLERLHTPVIIYTPGILFRRLVIMFLLPHRNKLQTQAFFGARLNFVRCPVFCYEFLFVLKATQWCWVEYLCPKGVMGRNVALWDPFHLPITIRKLTQV